MFRDGSEGKGGRTNSTFSPAGRFQAGPIGSKPQPRFSHHTNKQEKKNKKKNKGSSKGKHKDKETLKGEGMGTGKDKDKLHGVF
jgi:hypothetical protein